MLIILIPNTPPPPAWPLPFFIVAVHVDYNSFHPLLFWIFFENVMSMLRMRTVVTGLLEVGEVNDGFVTKKLGTAPSPTTNYLPDFLLNNLKRGPQICTHFT